MINLTYVIHVSYRGAIDDASTLDVGGLGFTSRRWTLSSVFFSVLFFPKTYFHFLTDLKYTGRLIAGSLSAFFSNIINNPQVSLTHPLILEC